MSAVAEHPPLNKLFKNSVLAWRAKYLASRQAGQQAATQDEHSETAEPAPTRASGPPAGQAT